MTALLGVIIAGGAAKRFGSDKGAALLHGKALMDHVAEALRPQVDRLIIVGRNWPDLESLPDRPHAGLGPLGGLNAALHFARDNGFDHVLTASCDALPVPSHLRTLFGAPPAVIADQYLFGLWPSTLAERLDRHLDETDSLSVRAWLAAAPARQISSPHRIHNLNTPDDLRRYAALIGSSAPSADSAHLQNRQKDR